MKKILSIAASVAFLVGLQILTTQAQTALPISPFVYVTTSSISTQLPLPVTITNLAGHGTVCAQINNSGTLQAASGACGTGGGGASSSIVFLANGQAFVTTSTINFQAGTNVTIATSTNGTYTINSSAGGGSTTINGTSSASFSIIGDNLTVTSTVVGTTTTFRIINTGNWAGTWQGVNSSTFYLATNPNNYISSSTGNALYYPLSSNPAGYVTSSTAPTGITSINGGTSAAYNILPGTNITVSTTTSGTTINSTGGSGSNNATGTIDATAVFNATNTIVSSQPVYIPSDFATNGCAGSSTAITFQGCVEALSQKQIALGTSGMTVIIPVNIAQANWTNSLNLNHNNFIVQYQCTAGVTMAYGGGANATSAVIFNFGNPIGHGAITEGAGCMTMGHSTLIAAAQTNLATTTGLSFGGSNGAVGINYVGNVNGFGRNYTMGQNAYMDAFTGTSSGGNCGGGAANMTGCLGYYPPANNSGERALLSGTYTDPGNNTTTNAIYIDSSAVASLFCSNLSLDDAQMAASFSNGLITCDNIHVENSAFGTYGQYIPFVFASSYPTMVKLTSIEIANDGNTTSTSFQTIIKHGVNLYAAGIHIDNYGGQTINQFSDHSLANGTESEQICQIQTGNMSGGLNFIVSNQAYSKAVGTTCVEDQANSYPWLSYIDSSNIAHFRNGNADVSTVDSLGNWEFGIAGSSGSVNVQGNVNATGTVSASGNINAKSPSGQYLINGSTVILASTTASDYFFGGAGNASVAGADNNGIGLDALNACTDPNCSFNTSIGQYSSGDLVSGSANAAVGLSALTTNVSGSNNTAIGTQALNNSTGNNNAALGSNAGALLGPGNNNILIGPFANLPSSSTNGGLDIGNIIYGTGLTQFGVATSTVSAGSLSIGTTTANGLLFVNGTTTSPCFSNNGTTCITSGGSSGVASSSPVSSGTIPKFTTVGNITNSNISESGNSEFINATNTYFGASATTATSSLIWLSNGNGAGYWDATGTTPTLSSCGTNPTSTGNQWRSRVVVGSVAATACTITFPTAFIKTPSCIVTNESMSVVNAMTYTANTSTLVVSQTGLTGDGLDIDCVGQSE